MDPWTPNWYIPQVLGAYLLGSRMWGSHHVSSDYDVFLVVENLPNKQKSRRTGARFSTSISIRGVAADVLLATLSDFQMRLGQARGPDLFCFLAPADCVLLENQMLTMLRGTLVFEMNAIINEGSEAASEAWEQSQKLMRRGDVRKGKKVLGHSYRILV